MQPAHWTGSTPLKCGVAAQAQVGDAVKIQVGGAFHLDEEDLLRPLLLVAGGIGITPLHSILSRAAQSWASSGTCPSSICLWLHCDAMRFGKGELL